LLLGGNVYFTCTQNMKLVTTEFKSGYMRSMYWQLGVLGTISAIS